MTTFIVVYLLIALVVYSAAVYVTVRETEVFLDPWRSSLIARAARGAVIPSLAWPLALLVAVIALLASRKD